MRSAGVSDVQFLVVGTKIDLVWLENIVRNQLHFECHTVDTVDRFFNLKLGFVSCIIANDAVARFGKPNAVAWVNGDVIGCVQLFALPLPDTALPRSKPGLLLRVSHERVAKSLYCRYGIC